MTKTDKLIMLAATFAVGISAVSCGHKDNIEGSWTASAPTSIEALLPQASTANSLLSFDFKNGQKGQPGTVMISSLLEATQPVQPAPSDTGIVAPYEVSVSATASVNGTWTYKDDDKDDILISFDMSTLNVTVDPAGVAMSENILTGREQPEVDSLTNLTAQRWQRDFTAAVKKSLESFTILDDVEVTGNGSTLTFEVKDLRGNDRDIVLRKIIAVQ